MNVTKPSLERIDQHWAVEAIGKKQMKRASELTDRILVNNAVGDQIQFDFTISKSDYTLLDRASMAYELAAIEGLNAFLSPTSTDEGLRKQCATGAYRAFEIRRLLPLPEKTERRMFHILHLSSLAYCGERRTDLRRWYREKDDILSKLSMTDASWDKQLLNRLFECWVYLFRKEGWDNLSRIQKIIIKLREDQQQYETEVLNNPDNAENRAMALRLISLYHWAKATEIQATYTLQGTPSGVVPMLNQHFESAIKAATACADAQLEMLLRWLQVAGHQMIADSIWWVSGSINSRVTKFVREVIEQRALFELLPPQRTAVQEQGLFDQAATAIVVDMPTSGGKTLLAQFRILQAINQFDYDESSKGWVAYVAPTKALTAQITRTLRKDFDPIGVKVEQLTGAIEIDAFEEDLLAQSEGENAFDVLVATPEKLQLVIRNNKVKRPLALVVMDEAHNIESKTRGLRIELLLATIKRDCDSAKFLLLMPFVENPETIARWLAQDTKTGRSISLGTTPWKPNERIVGTFKANTPARGKRCLGYKTLINASNAIHLEGEYKVGEIEPKSVLEGRWRQTVSMAMAMSKRGTSIAVARNIPSVWKMAREACRRTKPFEPIPNEIQLVQNFLKNEISPRFELIKMLSHGVGVHHSSLSDEVKALMEWLAEENKLRVLCATTTIAQGINFPVSSVFLASRFMASKKYPHSPEMTSREFWNLAGRAGRIDQDSVGVVGLAEGDKPGEVEEYVSRATGELVSQLVEMLDKLDKVGKLNDLHRILWKKEEWVDFRCYVAHLWREKKNIDAVLSDTEQLLRNTFGYGLLESRPEQKKKAETLLEATRKYARKLSDNPEHATLADMTGFSPEGVQKAISEINDLENKLTADDWKPDSLFGGQSSIADLYGVMLKIPQLGNLEDIKGSGPQKSQIANITKDWVAGESIESIAHNYFKDGEFKNNEDRTQVITDTCQAIYRTLVNSGTWGISALSRMAGIKFEQLSESERHQINLAPAMIYHGVRSEEGVLLRMNSVPRSIAETLGGIMRESIPKEDRTIQGTRTFLKQSGVSTWERAKPKESSLSGEEYKNIWGILSGESVS